MKITLRIIHLFIIQTLFSSILNGFFRKLDGIYLDVNSIDPNPLTPKIKVTQEMLSKLNPNQYMYTQSMKIEPPRSTPMYKLEERGMYHCVVCDIDLFEDKKQYYPDDGYVTFWERSDNVFPMREMETEYDGKKNRMARSWQQCANCGANLGVVYADTKSKSYLRYSINSNSLQFKPFDWENEDWHNAYPGQYPGQGHAPPIEEYQKNLPSVQDKMRDEYPELYIKTSEQYIARQKFLNACNQVKD